MQLTPQQNQALQQLQAFVRRPGGRAFVLRGYAGTGKTTLVGRLVEWLDRADYRPVLLATTGRAAKVLQDKTGWAAHTVHSCIYAFQEVGGSEGAWTGEAAGQLQLDFKLRRNYGAPGKLVYIVDEASMISHEAAGGEHTAKFGSGSLLDDFLAYASGHKVVFVGDPCQLPPIGQNPYSAALDEGFLRQRYALAAEAFELREIVRQRAGSEILAIAGRFRDRAVSQEYEKYPKVKVPKGGSAHLYPSEEGLLAAYVQQARRGGFGSAAMLCHANWQCSRLNGAIRQALGRQGPLQPGELLMVVQNSYDVSLANGDQVVLEQAAFDCRRAGLEFYNVAVRALHNNERYQTKLIANLLHDDSAGLSPEQTRRLIIDFDQRVRHPGLGRNSEAYKQAMMADPYLNALRVKYGYAITCHKAQGGEWEHVFLNIFKSIYGMKRPELYRWYYTALTRAQHHLHLNDGWWVEGFDWRKGG
jgi:ATP-dependent exoDNAse (exonuclease V) alpha subunit